MNNTRSITSQLKTRHNSIVEQIESFPDTIYVGRLRNGLWANIKYDKKGLGLACFLSRADSLTWFSSPDKSPLELVEMSRKEAVKIARKEKFEYLHLLSKCVNEPLGHYKIT